MTVMIVMVLNSAQFPGCPWALASLNVQLLIICQPSSLGAPVQQ